MLAIQGAVVCVVVVLYALVVGLILLFMKGATWKGNQLEQPPRGRR